ncbi:MAG: tail fiber domain-containing protein, partial [Candidatus Binatia bacterium]
LLSNTTGGSNTASGVEALLSNTTGFNNTASGVEALRSNTTGKNNTAIGRSALFSNTTGSSNTASGANALISNTTGVWNTASGARALHNNATGGSNTASGVNALFSNTTGDNNTASGVGTLYSNTTGTSNTAIGFNADVSTGDLTNATAIGANAVVDASNKIRLGNGSVTVIEGQVAFTAVSDRNKKENFKPVDGEEVLNKIRQIPVNSWNYIGQDPEKFRHYGPVAQDFFAAFGNDGVGTIGTPTTINSGDMAGILMIAVQALERQNRDLKSRVEELERLIKERPYMTVSSEPVQ